MDRRSLPLVIDARPRGPEGLLAGHRLLGRPVLAHLFDLAARHERGPVAIHGPEEEHARWRDLLAERSPTRYRLTSGSPPEGAAVLRTDRLYDPGRLRRALRRGEGPEAAVLWRLDDPRGLAGAEDEWLRRQSYQPIGRYWALGPARALARTLAPTRIRPNGVTLTSAALVLGAAVVVATSAGGGIARAAAASLLAVALVLDTADGHLARLQGTASAFGRWLDANLDELGDMALHASIAWAAFLRDSAPAWLAVGMAYAMGKYLFAFGQTSGEVRDSGGVESSTGTRAATGRLAQLVRLAGHAVVRWHLWIVLAAAGRLDAALVAYALYFPARAVAVAVRKGVRRG